MGKEFNPDPNFTAWGPFIKKDTYIIQPVTYTDIIIAGIIFGLANCFAVLAIYIGVQQTRAARNPWRSIYVWMIWLELAASVVIGIECLLYLLKAIRPSFYFYMSILLNWSIQVQLLLQIIINRIRIILPDRKKGRQILIWVAIIVTAIDISVFCIWMPARLQINQSFVDLNNIWDRVEKCLYLIIDATLNWYFIRIVKANLVENGLEKYNKLVRFNQRIIFISLSMDVMIIAAMSVPNGFVYAIFHPLAYLVKLNIEMSMADLIKKIAMETMKRNESCSFVYLSNSIKSSFKDCPPSRCRDSFTGLSKKLPKVHGIRKTEEYSVHSTLKSECELDPDPHDYGWNTVGDKIPKPKSVSFDLDDIGILPDISKELSFANDEEARLDNAMEDEEILVKPEPALNPWSNNT